jgi:hypothetical protein
VFVRAELVSGKKCVKVCSVVREIERGGMM